MTAPSPLVDDVSVRRGRRLARCRGANKQLGNYANRIHTLGVEFRSVFPCVETVFTMCNMTTNCCINTSTVYKKLHERPANDTRSVQGHVSRICLPRSPNTAPEKRVPYTPMLPKNLFIYTHLSPPFCTFILRHSSEIH